MPTFSMRQAKESDVSLIEALIYELAIYEQLESEVKHNPGALYHWLFIEKRVHVLLAFENDLPVGFLLYFFNFSTFLKQPGIYVEDIYLRPDYRQKGYGKRLFQQVAKIALANACGRMELACLKWNQSSIDFYLALGATPLDEWSVYRVQEAQIRQLANC